MVTTSPFFIKQLHTKRLVALGLCSRMNPFNLGHTYCLDCPKHDTCNILSVLETPKLSSYCHMEEIRKYYETKFMDRLLGSNLGPECSSLDHSITCLEFGQSVVHSRRLVSGVQAGITRQ